MRPLLLLGLMAALPATAAAQVERYELARRLKAFEAAWEATPDEAARKRALAVLPAATTQFLSFRLTDAARTLDDATWTLLHDRKPTDAARWLASLNVIPERRLVDATEPGVKVTVRPMYATAADPADAKVWLGRPPVALKLPLPASLTVPLAPLTDTNAANWSWDDEIVAEWRLGHDTGGSRVWVTRVRDLKKRLAALKEPADLPAIETATIADFVETCEQTLAGTVPETDLPVAALIRRAEMMRKEAPKAYFTKDVTYVQWLTVPTAGAKTACRIFVPESAKAGKPLPVVVALHGAGGSENMFFESYGAGQIVKECQKRGWVLVCPRSGLGFLTGPPPVPAILAELGKRYPLDLGKVFLVGHSMGAAQAIDLAQKHPGAFAAVAALGGGGKVKDAKALAAVPTFVGVGTKDFALTASRKLAAELKAGGATAVTAKEYPDYEHLVIVRAALPDVFAGWDVVAAGRK